MSATVEKTEYANGIIAREHRVFLLDRCSRVEAIITGDLFESDICTVLKSRPVYSGWKPAEIIIELDQVRITPQQAAQIITALRIAQDVAAALDTDYIT